MMYSNNFAAAIKVNGKILREFGNTVYIPFGSEYQIRLKNLSTQRAKVNIEIDGNNVTEGGLVLNAFQVIDLERFIRNGNLNEGNKFKFIERTSKIEDHRGINVEDGIITIRYEFENLYAPLKTWKPTYQSYRGVNIPLKSYQSAISSIKTNDTGITVEGSKSNQEFNTTSWMGTDTNFGSGVLNIKLLGETEDNKKIREPVTVKTKLECKTCGTKNPTSSKFCSECGTSLQIVN